MATIKREAALKWIKEHPNTEFEIKFKKNDGTIRLMRAMSGHDDGTLVKNPLKAGAKTPEGVVKVYDVDKKEYRSFKSESLMSINLPEPVDQVDTGWIDIEESRIISATQVE